MNRDRFGRWVNASWAARKRFCRAWPRSRRVNDSRDREQRHPQQGQPTAERQADRPLALRDVGRDRRVRHVDLEHGDGPTVGAAQGLIDLDDARADGPGVVGVGVEAGQDRRWFRRARPRRPRRRRSVPAGAVVGERDAAVQGAHAQAHDLVVGDDLRDRALQASAPHGVDRGDGRVAQQGRHGRAGQQVGLRARLGQAAVLGLPIQQQHEQRAQRDDGHEADERVQAEHAAHRIGAPPPAERAHTYRIGRPHPFMRAIS